MSHNRFYDTVTFDVRDNATMMFFARTSDSCDIEDYMLLMRAIEDNFDESLYIEINEDQFGGHDLLSEVRMLDNTLTLVLHEPAKELDNESEIVLTFEATEDNLTSMEAGAFRVLGDAIKGGNA